MDSVRFVVLVLSVLSLNVRAAPDNCDRVKYTFEQNRFSTEVPRRIQGLDDSACGTEHCCTAEMQRQVMSYSRRDFAAKQGTFLGQLSKGLQQRADNFDDVFKEMLNSSKQEFHQMFMKTYGVIYEQNAYVFTDLFKELEKYYGKGHVDLTATLDDFFNILYQKMFTVLNAGYTFTDKYLECVNERMKELKPFGDVPSKLSTLLKRSFFATRTFSQSLHVAANIARNMQNLTISEECHVGVAQMSHCSECRGLGDLAPCPDHCLAVMRQCHLHHAMLDQHWNTFIDATDKVIERLLGPFNIEMVVIPIDIKISEAIMNFQENAQQVTQRVFAGCGKPILGRNRRESSGRDKRARRAQGEIPYETLDFSNSRAGGSGPPGGGGLKAGDGSAGGGGGSGGGRGEETGKLERVIRQTREVLRNSRGYWSSIPSQLCKDSFRATSCWDGRAKVNARQPPSTTLVNSGGSGVANKGPPLNRPPSSSSGGLQVSIPRSSLVNEQLYALQLITNKLKNAYNGVDVDWIDTEELDSGSGSGDGGADIEETGGSGDSPLTELPAEIAPSPPHVITPPPPPAAAPSPAAPEGAAEEHLQKNLPLPPPVSPVTPEKDNEIPQIPPESRSGSGTAWNGTTLTSGNRPNGALSSHLRPTITWLLPIVMVSFGNSLLGLVS